MTTNRKSVLVTGDFTIDWNIARIRRADGAGQSWNPDDRTRACWQRGGAALLGDLIEALARDLKNKDQGDFTISKISKPGRPVCPPDGRFHHSYAQWSLFNYSEKGGPEPPAWRVAEFIGLDRSEDGWAGFIEPQVKAAGEPDLIVLDDAGLGFRDRPELWSGLIKRNGTRPWIVLKMSRPVAAGGLWDSLRAECADRVIVIMTTEDLRRTEVQISRELSWERTAQDLAWELVHNPRVNALSDCAAVICSLDTSGAFLLRGRRGTLFFDPMGIEGTWSRNHPGGMIGYNSSLAAAVVRRLLLAPGEPDIERGVQSGIFAMRRLHQEGYGERGSRSPGLRLAFPMDTVVAALAEDKRPCSQAAVQDPVQHLRQGEDSPETARGAGFWTILQDQHAGGLGSIARRIVIEGPEAVLRDVPMGKFGALLTADRREIESFRGICSLIGQYCSQGRQSKPLSIAVFGAPGSGKSFGINEVARSLFPGLIKKLEFNVSQFTGVEGLHHALHQVRDTGLSGKIPLVFFDEFDATLEGQSLGWLRHFLMPMQDGAFLDGQIAHPVGPAIFVFAGGTSEKLEAFGGHLTPEEFRKVKGPDFVSRLKGFVNVMGPDPARGDPGGDPHYVLRRAILLRSLLLRQAGQIAVKRDGRDILNIDPGVLNAFLNVGRYRHGARSMESIMAMSRLAGKSAFERSSLPSESQLDLHVNGLEFLALVQQIVLTPETLERLSAAAHEIYCETKKAEGFSYGPGKSAENKTSPLLVPYGELPEWAKEANRVNVRTVPHKLAAAGYIMIPARSNQPALDFPGDDLEKLAELEHDLWRAAKIAAGFKPGKPTAEDPKRNEYLVDWAQLDENTKTIDRNLVKGIPRILARAGYAVEKIRK
ncbi:MAG: ATPase [Candidatus Aminicenantes bacterium]|nr:ATPase [Candidatus Aminicenantes bacterium]